MDRPVHVADHGAAKAHLLHGAADAGDRHDVADAVRVLTQDQHPVEVVADQLLGAEPDRAADGDAEADAEAADGRPDGRQEDRQDDRRDDRDGEPPDEAQPEGGDGLQAPAPLRAPDGTLLGAQLELPGRRGGGRPGDERPDHPGQHPVGEPGHHDHDRDDEHVARQGEEERAKAVRQVLHRR